jgi:hypothetical protein
VTFGHPEPVECLRGSGFGRTDEERAANVLRQRLIALATDSGAEPLVIPNPSASQAGSIRQ